MVDNLINWLLKSCLCLFAYQVEQILGMCFQDDNLKIIFVETVESFREKHTNNNNISWFVLVSLIKYLVS